MNSVVVFLSLWSLFASGMTGLFLATGDIGSAWGAAIAAAMLALAALLCRKT